MQLPDKLFYTIGDVSRITATKPHILRYWEAKFKVLRPARRYSGHRKYSQRDIDIINRIRHLIVDKKYTLAGARKEISRQFGGRPAAGPTAPAGAFPLLQDIKTEIEACLELFPLEDRGDRPGKSAVPVAAGKAVPGELWGLIRFPSGIGRAVSKLLFASSLLLLLSSLAPAAERPSRFELTLADHIGFVDGRSLIQVRENAVEGDRLSLPVLGVRHLQIPEADLDFWVNPDNAVGVQLRGFLVDGSRRLDDEADFNGTTLAAGQSIHTNPSWTSVGAFYKHRWTPACMKGGEVRGKIGVEFVSLDFRLNSGHAQPTPSSAGTETKEGFNIQELPVPTLGIELRRTVARSVALSADVSGNWINQWNSGRKEGGTIYLSQRRLEASVTARLADEGRFRRFHPFVGVFYYNFRQHEQSHEDDNLIQLSTAGPEFGFSFDF